MKRLILLICIFLFIAIGRAERAYSDSVNMLYTNYSIQQTMNEGYNLYATPDPESIIGYFSDSRSIELSNNNGLPLSAETHSTHDIVWASSSISLFSVQNYAFAHHDFFPSFPEAYHFPEGYIDCIGNQCLGITNVNASWGFQAIASSLVVNLLFWEILSYNDPHFLSASLWDTTDSTTLFSWDSANMHSLVYSNDYTFSVNPNHVYEFDVSAMSLVWNGNVANQNVTASITSIPETSTILLLGSGLIGLVGFSRKFKN